MLRKYRISLASEELGNYATHLHLHQAVAHNMCTKNGEATTQQMEHSTHMLQANVYTNQTLILAKQLLCISASQQYLSFKVRLMSALHTSTLPMLPEGLHCWGLGDQLVDNNTEEALHMSPVSIGHIK